MRDIELLARTLRHIDRDRHGGGIVTRDMTDPKVFTWRAGETALNGQAVQDLISDGWLAFPAGAAAARINAWPSFAGPRPP